MKKHKAILPILALVLCMGAFLFPTAAHAQANDTTPPTVTAELNGDILKITAKDDSGVEAIFVGGTRLSTLVNGTANVKLKDYAGSGKQVEVYATDTAGNRSKSVLIDNPYYVAPPESTTAPQPTPRPTQAPASTQAPESSSTPAPTQDTAATDLPEPQPPADEPSESVIPDGSNAFTPDGGGTVVDNATEDEGKEFFTVTATDGSVYYLIIDRQRGTQNVYFLSAVTRDDLLSLTEDGAATTPGLSQPEPQTPETPSQTQQPEPTEQPSQDNGGGNMGTIIFVLLAVAIAGCAGYYFKIVKPRKDAAREDEYEDYEDEDDLDAEDTDETYFFDEADEYHPGEQDTED